MLGHHRSGQFVCWVTTGQFVRWVTTGQFVCWVTTGQFVCWVTTGQFVCWVTTGQISCWVTTGQFVCWVTTGQGSAPTERQDCRGFGAQGTREKQSLCCLLFASVLLGYRSVVRASGILCFLTKLFLVVAVHTGELGEGR